MGLTKDGILQNLVNPSRIGVKLVLNTALVGIAGFIFILIFVSIVISDRFEALEDEAINQHIARTQGMLSSMKDVIQGKSLDWAIWTASYQFVEDWNQEFADENINFDSMYHYDVQAISFIRFDGSRSISAYYDFAKGGEDERMTRLVNAFVTDPKNVAIAKEYENIQGFTRIDGRLLVVSFAQIFRSDKSGTPSGFMVFGREVKTEDMFEALQVSASYDFTAPGAAPEITKLSRNLAIAVAARGIDGQPLATIRFSIPRKLKATGNSLLAIIGVGIAALIFAMISLLNRRLQAVVTAPLSAMEAHVSNISRSGELEGMKYDGRRDEIGNLTSGFNDMTRQLNRLRSELEIQSFKLGKSQNSADVMHNVRNGLSPVSTILSRLNEDLHLPSQMNVSKALRELSSPDLPATRQTKLVAFISAALERYDEQIGHSRNLVREAGRSLATVVEAIDQNQRSANSMPELETIDIGGFLSTNLATAEFSESGAIDVELNVDASHLVRANRILLSQIVSNLLANAKEAIEAAGSEDGKIVISVNPVAEQEPKMLCISFLDNGEGFEASSGNRLFERGFSTRSSKTGGTGLHWSANTLNAMGGSLDIKSAGKGLGAKAEILLPLCDK